MVDVERERERRRGGVGEKGERGVVVTEGEKKIKGGRRGEVRVRRWKEEWTGRGREGSRVVGGGWGTSGKTWSQLIAPSFHGNARPFPPTPSLLSLSLFLSASSTPSLLSHFSFFSDFFSLLHFFLFQSVSVITLQPPRLLLLAHLPLFYSS